MKNKLFTTFFIIFTISTLILTPVYASTNNSQNFQQTTAQNAEDHSIGYNLGRGFSNLLLCWLEIPRQIIYQGSEVPVFGLISGAIYGTALTAWRALSGVTDILSLGFGGGNIYFTSAFGTGGKDGGLSQFPWQGPWVRSKIPKND